MKTFLFTAIASALLISTHATAPTKTTSSKFRVSRDTKMTLSSKTATLGSRRDQWNDICWHYYENELVYLCDFPTPVPAPTTERPTWSPVQAPDSDDHHNSESTDQLSGGAIAGIAVIALAIIFTAMAIGIRKSPHARSDPDLPSFRNELSNRRNLRSAAANASPASAPPVQHPPPPSAPPDEEANVEPNRHQTARLHLHSITLESASCVASLPVLMAQESDGTERSKEESWRDNITSSIRSIPGRRAKTKPECSICLDHFEPGDEASSSNSPKCNHIFHTQCILSWLSSKRRNGSMHDSCPLCRHQIIPSSSA